MALTINTNMCSAGSESLFLQTKGNGLSIDARSLNLNAPESAADVKKNSARQQAYKIISDAWSNDEKTSKGIRSMEEEKNRKAAELADITGRINKLSESKKQLQEEYGVSDDSQEQRDLLLLEKYQDNINGVSHDSFSEEELERLNELKGAELTEYHKRALEANSAQGIWQIEADNIKGELSALTAAITDSEIERLKSRDMVKAADAADEIMLAASKDAVNMIVKESMEHIEEETEDAEEKEDNVSETQKRIRQVLADNNLINEDLKGIEIDLNF